MTRTRPQTKSVDGLRIRALILWVVITPIMIVVMVFAIALRPDRAASSDTNLSMSADTPSAVAEPDR